MLSTNQRDANGHTYYEFEFTASTPRYTRHQLAVVAAANGEKGVLPVARSACDV